MKKVNCLFFFSPRIVSKKICVQKDDAMDKKKVYNSTFAMQKVSLMK